MKKLLILLLLPICVSQIRAQTILDSSVVSIPINKSKLSNEDHFRIFAIKTMINAINFDKLIKAPKSFAQFASVSIIFNDKGVVDTSIVAFKLNKYFELKKTPTAELKSFKPILEYANVIVVLPILYIRMNETTICLENKFLEGFIDLFPSQFLSKKKNIVLLKPEINPFSQTK